MLKITQNTASRFAAMLTGCLLMTSGCIQNEVEPEPNSQTTAVTRTTLVRHISNNPDFEQWAKSSADVAGFVIRKTSTMTAAQLADFKASAIALKDALANRTQPLSELGAATTALTGLDFQTVQRLYEHSLGLDEVYPWLSDKGVALVGQAMEANRVAMARWAEQLAARNEASPPPQDNADSSIEDCEDECYDAYEKTGRRAMAAFIKEGSVCLALSVLASMTTGFGGPITYLICVATAAAEQAVKLAAAERRLDDCIAICNGDDPKNECYGDSDCDSDEFCHKVPFGILGSNQCRAKKSLGKVCSRDDKCQSGCCKYHFGTNAVSLVCRPSDKCN